MTKMAATPIYSKNPLEILFSGTKGPITFGLGMQNWGHGPNKIYSNDDLGLMARSNLLPDAFIWEIYISSENVRKSFLEETYNK